MRWLRSKLYVPKTFVGMEIFVIHDDEQFGPFSPQDVQAQIDSGKLSIADYAWTAGLDGWKPIHELLSQLKTLQPDKSSPVTSSRRMPLSRKPVFGECLYLANLFLFSAVLSLFWRFP